MVLNDPLEIYCAPQVHTKSPFLSSSFPGLPSQGPLLLYVYFLCIFLGPWEGSPGKVRRWILYSENPGASPGDGSVRRRFGGWTPHPPSPTPGEAPGFSEAVPPFYGPGGHFKKTSKGQNMSKNVKTLKKKVVICSNCWSWMML